MIVAVLAAALMLALFPAALRPLGQRLVPAHWARLCAAALAVSLIAVEVTAILLAAPTVLKAVGVHALAARCARMAGSVMAGGTITGWSAAVAALAFPLAAFVGFRRARRGQSSLSELALIGRRECHHGVDVVIVPSPEPVALALPAYGGSVVVSDTLVESLDDEQFAVVVRHEQAHLRHRHHRYLILATVAEHAFAALPFVRRSTAGLRCALERWADEEAVGSSMHVRRTAQSALVRVAFAGMPADVAGFGGVTTATERIKALAGPPPTSRPARWLAAVGPVSLMAVGALIGTAVVIARLWLVLRMPFFCPS